MSCGLREFPAALFDLADTLEVLDLSGNQLSTLPDDFDRLHKLRILFLSDNDFRSLPAVLADCPLLEMIGFKANRIESVPEHSLPHNLRWLILTDNRITSLPDSMGKLHRLQKLMLAGNLLTTLPHAMVNCRKLELVRIAANCITELPTWLLQLPRLAWLAFAGNPCCNSSVAEHDLEEIHWDELQVGKSLGEGASGVISHARWQDRFDVALKAFKGEVTSDGLPADEMAATIAAGEHANLIDVIGSLAGHPEQKNGLLLSLVAEDFRNLAGPPSLASCSRDCYPADCRFSLSALLSIASGIASAVAHLHQRHIMHGDLYGHNILHNDAEECLLGDFGAATRYDGLDASLHLAIERLEVRAFGILLGELLVRLQQTDRASHALLISQLNQLQESCINEDTTQRPGFATVEQVLSSL